MKSIIKKSTLISIVVPVFIIILPLYQSGWEEISLLIMLVLGGLSIAFIANTFPKVKKSNYMANKETLFWIVLIIATVVVTIVGLWKHEGPFWKADHFSTLCAYSIAFLILTGRLTFDWWKKKKNVSRKEHPLPRIKVIHFSYGSFLLFFLTNVLLGYFFFMDNTIEKLYSVVTSLALLLVLFILNKRIDVDNRPLKIAIAPFILVLGINLVFGGYVGEVIMNLFFENLLIDIDTSFLFYIIALYLFLFYLNHHLLKRYKQPHR